MLKILGLAPKVFDLQSIHGSCRLSQAISRMRSYLESKSRTRHRSILSKSKYFTTKFSETLGTVTRLLVDKRTVIESPSCHLSALAYCFLPLREQRQAYLHNDLESIKIDDCLSKSFTVASATNMLGLYPLSVLNGTELFEDKPCSTLPPSELTEPSSTR